MGLVVTGQMSPMNLAAGEAGGTARRDHRPETHMAVFFCLINDPSPHAMLGAATIAMCPLGGHRVAARLLTPPECGFVEFRHVASCISGKVPLPSRFVGIDESSAVLTSRAVAPPAAIVLQ